jgi:uncharacterized membrane protein
MSQLNETTRIEAFSDGVFAIAITLLILDVKVPHDLPKGTSLSQALLQEWPSYMAYITSFATIAIMWINHHQLFTLIKRADRNLMLLNCLLLLAVTLTPFPTSMLAEYFPGPEEKIAAAAFSGLFVFIAIVFNLLWWFAAKGNRLLDKNADEKEMKALGVSYLVGPAIYLAAFAAAFFNATLSVCICLAMAVYYAMPKKNG